MVRMMLGDCAGHHPEQLMARRSWCEDCLPEGECGGQTVHEPEDRDMPKPTGILNRRGEMIYRQPERIGFNLKGRR